MRRGGGGAREVERDVHKDTCQDALASFNHPEDRHSTLPSHLTEMPPMIRSSSHKQSSLMDLEWK